MLKKLGFGLDADERYRRAFEKGVFLGDFAGAARLFSDAATAYEKVRNVDAQRLAAANANLYQFLNTRNVNLLGTLIGLLRQIESIESIGSATETVSAKRLATELEAWQLEQGIKLQPPGASNEARAAEHDRASEKFAALRAEPLLLYRHIGEDDLIETAESRRFLHAGWASWYRARALAAHDPGAAADEMSQAMVAFRRAGLKSGEDQATQQLAHLRLARTCWICGREMQAHGTHFAFLPTTVLPYHASLLRQLKQDESTLRFEDSRVAVCVVCRDVVTHQARQMAKEVIQPLTQELAALQTQVTQLTQLVNRLRSRIPGA